MGATGDGAAGGGVAVDGVAVGAGATGAGRGPAEPDEEMTRRGVAGAGAGAVAGVGGGVVVSPAVTVVSAPPVSTPPVWTGVVPVDVVGSVVSSAGFFAATFFAAAFFAAAFFAGAGASVAVPSVAVSSGVWAPFAAAFFAAAFFGFSGSSGWTSRMRPSLFALRRTRSAWASTTLDEAVFTPMPSPTQRSSVSLVVSPSSLASSWTRMFAGNCYLNFESNVPGQQPVTAFHPRTTEGSRTNGRDDGHRS